MKFHKYDSVNFLYIETLESEYQPENSVTGYLPEITEYYSIAYMDGEWVSVVNPKYEIINDQFVKKES